MGKSMAILENKIIRYFLVGVIFFLCVITVLISLEDQLEINILTGFDKPIDDVGYQMRGIGTLKKLWLNGYFGPFFRIEYFGLLSWLFIPLSFHFLVMSKRRKKWKLALWLVMFFYCIVICTKGFPNYRYQFTLFPIFITINLIYLLSADFKKKLSPIFFVPILTALIAAQIYLYWDDHIAKLKSYLITNDFNYPAKLINVIENDISINNETVILECNQPLLYYYTKKKGLHYLDYDLKKYIYRNKKIKPIEKRVDFLKTNFNIKYILTDSKMQHLLKGTRVGNFLDHLIPIQSDLVIEEYGYKLYKIRNETYNLSLNAFEKRIPIRTINISSWNELSPFSSERILDQRNDLPVKIQGIRGEFYFYPDKHSGLQIRFRNTIQNTKPTLQFGFVNETELEIKDDDLVSVIARVRTNSQASGTVYLFIQDKTKKWIREKTAIHGTGWRDYLVVHKMRRGYSHMNIGFYWEPETINEWLEVSSFKIYNRNMEEKQKKSKNMITETKVLIQNDNLIEAIEIFKKAVELDVNAIGELNDSESKIITQRLKDNSAIDILLNVEFSPEMENQNRGFTRDEADKEVTFEEVVFQEQSLSTNYKSKIIIPNEAINLDKGTLYMRASLSGLEDRYSNLVRINNNKDLYIYRQGANGKIVIFYGGVRLGQTNLKVKDNEFHDYIFTWRNGRQRFFIDGIECLTAEQPALNAETKVVAIGWLGNRDGEQWVGYFDKVSTYNRPLHISEILALTPLQL